MTKTFTLIAALMAGLAGADAPTPAHIEHLLNRAAFGPSAADRDKVAAQGIDRWLEAQLAPGTDAALEKQLEAFPTLRLSVAETYARYPPLKKRAKELGIDLGTGEDAKEKLAIIGAMNREELPRQVMVELTRAKLLRAVNSERQLEEVLTDFWFNHFNVNAEKGRVRWMISAWERDAIRPHVFGKFRELLGATAKHPAMLFYLDNWLSTRDGFNLRELPKAQRMSGAGKSKELGLNENYARELLELHTLGVNAGYTQNDVRESARALTGWGLELREKLPGKGFFSDDDDDRLPPNWGGFVYRDLAHDKGAKKIFGLTLETDGRMDDGEKLLDFLARHPATAKHLAQKLCEKFVSDTPPPALVDAVAAEYLRTDGDLKATYRAIFRSKDFWASAGAKTRTPLEFVVASIRAVGTLESAEQPLAKALESLGMPLYRAQAPTGYSERAETWVNAGALVGRINFGLALMQGKVKGVKVNLPLTAALTPERTVDQLGLVFFGRPVSEATKATVLKAVAAPAEDKVDEPKPTDVRQLAGLLLGSPEFQKQ